MNCLQLKGFKLFNSAHFTYSAVYAWRQTERKRTCQENGLTGAFAALCTGSSCYFETFKRKDEREMYANTKKLLLVIPPPQRIFSPDIREQVRWCLA